MAQSLKTKGKIEIVSSDGKRWESPNFVVDLASEYVAKILYGTFSGTLYRIGIGNGGYSGLPPTRTLPNDGWYEYTDMQGTSKITKPITTKTIYVDGHVTSINMVCSFSGTDHAYGSGQDLFSEACLILGSGTSGTQVAPNHKGVNDIMYAYRTFDAFQLPAGSNTTITVNWTIFVENA